MASKLSSSRYLYIFLECLPWYLALSYIVYWELFPSTLPTTTTGTVFYLFFFTLSFISAMIFLLYRSVVGSSTEERRFVFPMTKTERATNDIARSVPCALALTLLIAPTWIDGWLWVCTFAVPFVEEPTGAEYFAVVLSWFWFFTLGFLWAMFGTGFIVVPWAATIGELAANGCLCCACDWEDERMDVKDIEMGIVATTAGTGAEEEGYNKTPLMGGEAEALRDGRT